MIPQTHLQELTTAADVLTNARAVQARITASRRVERQEPAAVKVEAPPIVPTSSPKKTKEIKEPAPRSAEPYPEIVILHSISKIIRAVAWFYNISPVDIISARREAKIVRPRQIAAYFAKALTPYSLPEIGRRIGGRDHTTILHSCRRIASLRAVDPQLDADITALEAKLMPVVKMRSMEVTA